MIKSVERGPIKTTQIQGREIKVYGSLFLAKDVAEWLDISNYRDMVSKIDESERGVISTDTLGGKQEMVALTEDGLYEVLMQSRKPAAKIFKRGMKRMLREMRTHRI